MGEVVSLSVSTTVELEPETILSGALNADLSSAFVLGWDQEGDFYIASSDAEIGSLLLMLELAKQELLDRV